MGPGPMGRLFGGIPALLFPCVALVLFPSVAQTKMFVVWGVVVEHCGEVNLGARDGQGLGVAWE